MVLKNIYCLCSKFTLAMKNVPTDKTRKSKIEIYAIAFRALAYNLKNIIYHDLLGITLYFLTIFNKKKMNTHTFYCFKFPFQHFYFWMTLWSDNGKKRDIKTEMPRKIKVCEHTRGRECFVLLSVWMIFIKYLMFVILIKCGFYRGLFSYIFFTSIKRYKYYIWLHNLMCNSVYHTSNAYKALSLLFRCFTPLRSWKIFTLWEYNKFTK